MRPRKFWDPSLLSLSHILRGRDLLQDIGSHWDFSLLRRRIGSWVFQPHQQRRRKTSTFRRRASEGWRVSPSSATSPLAIFSHLLFQLHPMLSIRKLSKKQPYREVLVCLPGN